MDLLLLSLIPKTLSSLSLEPVTREIREIKATAVGADIQVYLVIVDSLVTAGTADSLDIVGSLATQVNLVTAVTQDIAGSAGIPDIADFLATVGLVAIADTRDTVATRE